MILVRLIGPALAVGSRDRDKYNPGVEWHLDPPSRFIIITYMVVTNDELLGSVPERGIVLGYVSNSNEPGPANCFRK